MNLVMLPANGHDARDFQAIAARLGGEAWDWPLVGASASAAGWADWLEQRARPAVYLGHSVGGFAAARLAARRPELVRAIVLINPGGFQARMSWLDRAFCSWKGRPAVTGAIEGLFARYHTKRRNEHVRSMFERIDERRRQSEWRESVAAVWRSFATPAGSVLYEAHAIRCPTLVVYGRRDPVIRPAAARAATAAIAGARLVELDAGHCPFVEDPDAFVAAVTPFLRELGALGS